MEDITELLTQPLLDGGLGLLLGLGLVGDADAFLAGAGPVGHLG